MELINILYINNSVHLGGDTKCILKLCEEFRKNNRIFVASRGGSLKERFEEIGVEHIRIGDVKNKSFNNLFKIILQIRKIIKEENIDIIHSHHRMTTLLSKIAVKNLSAKVIHTQHLCITDKLKLTNIVLKNIDIITVSDGAKNILVNNCGLDIKRINTIYNTIDNKVIHGEVDERLIELKKKGYFIVAQVSRLISYKGIYDFVDIAEQTIRENNNIRFVFIGDGPDKVNLDKYILKKGLENKVILLGSKRNIIEHLNYINLFILCSHIEGLPLTPIEAFSQKIPVIATDIPGTNEEIDEGINGYLIPVGDINSFKEKILYFNDNNNELIKLGEAAYNSYLSKFNLYKYIKRHQKIYENNLK